MNVDRRWWGTSVLEVRILAAGLLLLGVGWAVLGCGTRFGKTVQNHANAPGASVIGLEESRELQAHAHSILAGLPLIFEPNLGQANLDPSDSRARFTTHGSGYSMVLGNDGAILSLVTKTRSTSSSGSASRVQTLRMKLAGANANASLRAVDQLPGKSNYFIGNEPAKWRTGVPQFARVRYDNVYPGINLVFYGNEGHLEYDFQVEPGGDPSRAELEFSGAEKLELRDGSLMIRGENASIRFDAPSVYQEIGGRKQTVDGAFVLRAANRVGFAVGAYDHSKELIIDPILNFSTYFGGSGDEHNTSVAVDGSLNIYLTGSTTSPNLPVTPSTVLQGTLHGAQNVYVAKIQPPLGSQAAKLLELTYLGGSNSDYPVGIEVDGGGNPYVAGTTTSGNFPTITTSAYQASPASAGTHVFVTKLSSDFTTLDYSSYLSGNGTDIASGMTIDPAGDLYVTGTTTSVETSSGDQFPASNLPDKLPFQSTSRATAGTPQFFVTKVNTGAQGIASIPYSTYFGGGVFNGTFIGPNGTAVPAAGGGIAVDTNLNIYFTGTTTFIYSGCSGCSVTDFPILNAYQPCLDSPPATNIVNPQSCANTVDTTHSDAFVAKLNPNAPQGQQLIWSTYVGGGQSDSGAGVAIDAGAANVYVVGTTSSPDFISTGAVISFAPYQKCLNNQAASCGTKAAGPTDAFVARLSNPSTGATNIALNYFSYLGGKNDEQGLAIAVDSNSGAMITGWTQSPFVAPAGTDGNFPVFPFPSSIQSNLNGTQDAFIARLNTGATVGQTTTASWASYFGGTGIDAGTGIALDVNQNSYLAGETNSTDLQVSKPLQLNNGGGFDSFVTQFGTAVSLSIEGVLSLGTNQQYISAGTPAMFTYTVTNNGPDLASNIVITADMSLLATGVQLTNVSGSLNGAGVCSGSGSTNPSISCGPISLQSGSTATLALTATPTANSSGTSPVFFNGGTVQAMAPGNIVLAQTSVSAQMTDFDMKVTPPNQAIAVAGATANYTVQLTPRPVYNPPSGITISCSGLPAASSCSPSTSPVSLTSTSGSSVTLAVHTTARPVITPAAGIFTRRFYAIWLIFPGIALVGAGSSRRRRRIFWILMLCTLFTLLLLVPACSSSKTQPPVSGTPAGNYTITVTSAGGTDSKTQTIGLTVP
ncbi:MAG TPA: SBBP repeat-containing protein [Candidatus Sulfotelmatobacter sp.]|nr:SBBP repeat-containing protein [Candidatus Sulfotelmatobacter sp.]